MHSQEQQGRKLQELRAAAVSALVHVPLINGATCGPSLWVSCQLQPASQQLPAARLGLLLYGSCNMFSFIISTCAADLCTVTLAANASDMIYLWCMLRQVS